MLRSRDCAPLLGACVQIYRFLKPGDGGVAEGFGLYPVSLPPPPTMRTTVTNYTVQVERLLLLPSPPIAMVWGGGDEGVSWELVMAGGGGGLQRLRGVKRWKGRGEEGIHSANSDGGMSR